MTVNQVLKDSRRTMATRAFSVRTDTAYNFTCACGASMNTASSAQLDKFVKEHNTEHIERVIELAASTTDDIEERDSCRCESTYGGTPPGTLGGRGN